MHIREILIEALRSAVDRLASGERPHWPAIFDRLDEARAVALAEMDTEPGFAASVVTAVNVLFDCARNALDLKELQAALAKLDVSHGWNAGLGGQLLRKGPNVVLQDDSPMGFSAIAWKNFVRYYATPLGYGVDDRSLEQLWADLQSRVKRIPLGEIDIADQTGNSSAWVTDDGREGAKLKTDDPTRDVYNELGLSWPHSVAEAGGKTRAVLLCCPLHIRLRAAKSLHCPNSADGWGNLLFVPRQSKESPWPDHGSRAARPTSDEPTLPEAVHGPAKVSRESVDVVPLGHAIAVGDRVTEYGEQAMQRAIGRLRRAVGL